MEIASKLTGKELKNRAEKAVRDALDLDNVVMVV